jgi:uridine phosphorylase
MPTVEQPTSRDPLPPILEFDPAPSAVINAAEVITPLEGVDGCAVTFFHVEADRLVADQSLPVIATIRSEMGDHPVYGVSVEGRTIGLFKVGVGAALAAGMLEELIALGFRSFIACGSAGVLDREIQYGHLVVPTSAVRQEGASYHYLPAGRPAVPDPVAVAEICRTLEQHRVPYLTGPTWTTDGFFRETHGLVKRRRAQGCLTVEMEAAALFAVAAFRSVRLAMILYGGDDVSQEKWDRRLWKVDGATAPLGNIGEVDTRTALLMLAIETVTRWTTTENSLKGGGSGKESSR